MGKNLVGKISIVTTAFNEEKNIAPMHKKIKEAMKGINYEIIAVDDGSTDGTLKELKKINDPLLRIIKFEKRTGKDFALYKGIQKSNGTIIATIDADLQDEPRDIPLMIKLLGKNCDCVFGWRFERKDGFVKRNFSSVGNFLNNLLLEVNLHDNGCPVKVFKKKCVAKVKYFENFHRFIPLMIKTQRFKIKEFKVKHHPRIHGVSKYGVHNRIVGNIKTFLKVKFGYNELLE